MNPKTLITFAIVGVAGALIFVAISKAAKAASAAVDAVNPTNNDNVFARGFDQVITLGQADEGFSLGSFIFDLFNPEFDPNAPTPSNDDDELELIRFDNLPGRRGPVVVPPAK